MTGKNVQRPFRRGEANYRSAKAATAMFALLLLSLLVPQGAADESLVAEVLEEPPIQHELCPDEGAVLVVERRFSTGGWFRLYQNHVTGDVYISWEFTDNVDASSSSAGVFEDNPPGPPYTQDGHQFVMEEASGYCQFIESIGSDFYFQVYRAGVGQMGGRSKFMCLPKQISPTGFQICLTGPNYQQEWLEGKLCDLYPPGFCGPRHGTFTI